MPLNTRNLGCHTRYDTLLLVSGPRWRLDMAPVEVIACRCLLAFASFLGQIGAALKRCVIIFLISPVNQVVAVLWCVGLWPIPFVCDVLYQLDQSGRMAHGMTVQHEDQVVVLSLYLFLLSGPKIGNALGLVAA